MIHKLKIEQEYFKAVTAGSKTFEIRKNDRKFQVGDFVILQEINKNKIYTGKEEMFKITYITDYAQQNGYVVFGIKKEQIISLGEYIMLKGLDRPYNEWYLARDADGILNIFEIKPVKINGFWQANEKDLENAYSFKFYSHSFNNIKMADEEVYTIQNYIDLYEQFYLFEYTENM